MNSQDTEVESQKEYLNWLRMLLSHNISDVLFAIDLKPEWINEVEAMNIIVTRHWIPEETSRSLLDIVDILHSTNREFKELYKKTSMRDGRLDKKVLKEYREKYLV